MAGPFNLGALVPMLEPGSFVAKFSAAQRLHALADSSSTAIGLAVLYRAEDRPTSPSDCSSVYLR